MLLGTLLAFAMHVSASDTETMYIGTYTDPAGSKGIYRVVLDSETGQLSEPVLAVEATAPSYIAIHPSGKFLYSVNEYSSGEASSFKVQAEGLKKLNTVTFDGGGSCHISIDPSGKWAFISAYGGGALTLLPILGDGSLGKVSDRFANKGSGPNKQRQERPHMHFSSADPSGKLLYACDLGTDEILGFRLDDKPGKLTPIPSVKAEPGAGPRHFAMDPRGRHLYCANELALTISVFRRNTDTGALSPLQTLSALDHAEPKNGMSMAAIRVHSKKPFAYASIRGKDAIAVFGIQADGRLKLIENQP
ncbi:MAG: lactonase family protein, partial [Fimbriimonadaceae bacterium]|nr:lactonase family protein [Fimbriimonadaceae bacterium]